MEATFKCVSVLLEWVQDHIEKIIDRIAEGTGLEGEKKRMKRGESVESIKDGIQRKHSPPFSPLLPNLLLSLCPVFHLGIMSNKSAKRASEFKTSFSRM